MFEEIQNIKIKSKDLRYFGIAIGVLLLVVTSFLALKNESSFQIYIYAACLSLITGLLFPNVLKPIYFLWMIFALIIGWFMTRVVLGLVFYFIISPIGLLARFIGKDFLELRKSSDNKSYWNNRDSDMELNQDYEKQF